VCGPTARCAHWGVPMSGMTGGTRPSAAAGGGKPSWAALGREAKRATERRVERRQSGGFQGLPPDFANWAAHNGRTRKGKKREGFSHF
jgi:hypothetical protein